MQIVMHNIISYCDITKRNFLSPGGSNCKNYVNTLLKILFHAVNGFLGFLKKEDNLMKENFEIFG